LIHNLQTKGYEVEIRALAAHRLESELGVDQRFLDKLDEDGYGRYVPQRVRDDVYKALPDNLNKVHASNPEMPILIYNREGKALYDSRISDEASGHALTRIRQDRVATPKITRALSAEWKEQLVRHQNLPETLAHNEKVSSTTAQTLLGQREESEVVLNLERSERQISVLDEAVRIEPQRLAVEGLKAAGIAGLAIDAASTTANTTRQINEGNNTAAQSEVLHFGGRNLGMAAGAVAGTELGAAAGIESGPGVFVTGAVGGIVGAIGGDKLMDAADQARIYRQRGSDGNLWHRDSNHPAQGWTRMVRTHEIDTSVLPNLDTGMPVYKIQTLRADAHLADELNYKASNTAVELRLGHPNPPQDPYTQRPDPGEMGKGFIYGDWKRDAAGQWNRSAADMRHGPSEMRELHQVADPQKTAQLNAAARKVEQENAAHTPQAIAQEYQKAYDQYGWKQYGPMPTAVTNHLQAAQQPSHTPSAQASVVPHSQPAPSQAPEPARPKPITKDSSIDEMFEALMAAKDDETLRAIGRAYDESDMGRQRLAEMKELGKQRMEQQDMERLLAFKDPRNPQHPDHALYQQIREQLPGVYATQGVYLSPTELENGVASVMACARKSRMTEITSMSAGQSSNQPGITRVFMYQNKPGENSGPNKFNYTDIIQAIATPAQESYQQFDKITQQNQAQDLQMEMQRQQQAMSRGGFSR
jgi:hypothetical protein